MKCGFFILILIFAVCQFAHAQPSWESGWESGRYALPNSSLLIDFRGGALELVDGKSGNSSAIGRYERLQPMPTDTGARYARVFQVGDGQVLVAFAGGSLVMGPKLDVGLALRASVVVGARAITYVVISSEPDRRARWVVGRQPDGGLVGDATGGALFALNETVEAVSMATQDRGPRDSPLRKMLRQAVLLTTLDPEHPVRGFTWSTHAWDAQTRPPEETIAKKLIPELTRSIESLSSFRKREPERETFHVVRPWIKVITKFDGFVHRVSLLAGPDGEQKLVWKSVTTRFTDEHPGSELINREGAVYMLDGNVALVAVQEGSVFFVQPTPAIKGKLRGFYFAGREGARHFLFTDEMMRVQTIVSVTSYGRLMRANVGEKKLTLPEARALLSRHTSSEAIANFGLHLEAFDVLNAPHYEMARTNQLTKVGDQVVDPRGPIDSFGPMRRVRIPGSDRWWLATFRNGMVAVIEEYAPGHFHQLLTLQEPARFEHPELAPVNNRFLPQSLTPHYATSQGEFDLAPPISTTPTHVIYGQGSEVRDLSVDDVLELLSEEFAKRTPQPINSCQLFTREDVP